MASIPIPLSIWSRYADRRVLPDLKIEILYEDSRGKLWIGTAEGGVVRFDGDGFTCFNADHGLCGNAVYSVTEDDEGALWFGTNNGLSRFDGKKFATIENTPRSYVWGSCKGKDGKLWFGLGRRPGRPLAVACWDGSSLRLVELDFSVDEGQSVHSISEGAKGQIWIGGDGVYAYDGKFICIADAQSNLRQVTDVFDRGDKVFIASDTGFWVYDNAQLSQQLSEKSTDLTAMAIVEDENQDLWFTTADGRLFQYDTAPRLAFAFNAMLSHGLCVTRDGSLWVGTFGRGLYRFPITRMRSLSAESGLPDDSVNAVVGDGGGGFYIATSRGVARYAGGQVVEIGSDQSRKALSICMDGKDRVWVGYRDGQISIIDKERVGRTPGLLEQLQEARALCFGEDAKGRMWFGTELGKGVGYYQNWQLHLIQQGPAVWVGDLVIDKDGSVWVGSSASLVADRGLYLFDEGEQAFTRVARIAELITALCVKEQGCLWIGTTAGVLCWNRDRIEKVAGLDALATLPITSLHQTDKGTLWIGTEGLGVYVFDGVVLQHIQLPGGLEPNIVNQVYEDKQGQIWFATEGGLIQYNPCVARPGVVVSHSTGGDERKSSDEVRISALGGAITFHLEALDIIQGKPAYLYRMRGVDRDWVQSWDDFVEYPQLEAGAYVFEVRAVDLDLNYSNTASIKVVVEDHADFVADARLKRQLLGVSAGIKAAWQFAEEASSADLPVLILGETGVGKGLLAQLVHLLGERNAAPFMALNCGSIPPGLISSELFGHERGAFTGAVQRQQGSFELADGGTLFLDEIGDLPLELQLHFLHVLQGGKMYRLGGTKEIEVDVRIITATNKDLRQLIAEGRFREDLFYRLHGFSFLMPPLRERKEDIVMLAEEIVDKFARSTGLRTPALSRAALRKLRLYHWPGNVRELEYVLQVAVIKAKRGGVIDASHLRFWESPSAQIDFSDIDMGKEGKLLPMEEVERRHMALVLAHTQGKVNGPGGAAEILDLKPTTLKSRMKRLGLDRRDFRGS